MAQLSKFNNTYSALNASATFVGQLESTADLVSISVNTHCEQACRVIIKQYRTRDLTTQVQENAEDVAADTRQLVQTPIKSHFYLIEVVNLAAVDMSFSRITTYLQSTHYVNLDIRKLSEETDKVTTISGDSKTSTGDIIVNGTSGSATRPVYLMNVGTWYRVASVGNTSGAVWNAIGSIVGGESIPTVGRLFKCLSAPSNIEGQGTVYDVEYSDTVTTISGDSKTSTGDIIVNGTSGSATRSVYLMNVGTWYRVASVGNTPGHVWNSIGAIVGGESIPTVGRLFKCLSAPSNIEGQGTVYDVEYSDTLTATPTGTQDVNIVSTVTVPVSGSVALLPAADPTLTLGTVRLNDAYGSPLVTTAGNLMVGINNIYTANPLHTIVDSGAITETNSGTISSTLTSLNGKVTACNTGAVVITTLPAITLSKTTSSITTWENPSSIISFDSGNTVRNIKSSAGSLQSLSLVNDNNALAFVALYDSLAVDVSAGTTTPLAVIVIQKDQAIQLATHNLNFSVALSFYIATAYNGATPLTNVYVTAAYNS